jgi:transposase
MPRPYSDDLRRKLLETYEAGADSLRDLATGFRVSWDMRRRSVANSYGRGRRNARCNRGTVRQAG